MKRFFVAFAILLFAFSAFSQAKYVFYMIGDGMGPNEVLTTEMYLAELQGQIGRNQLCMTSFPYSGQASTYSASNSITDSSAAGTCLASGKKTTNGMLGVTSDGSPVTSVAEILHEQGWNVGVMTSVSIDHATPGAFYAHSNKRSSYYLIGSQLAASGYEFFGGSSFLQPVDKKHADAPNLYTLCEQNGYRFAHGVAEFAAIAKESDKVILIPENEGRNIEQAGPGMIPYAIDKNKHDLTLPQITSSAIDFLSKKDRPFFMMVEGGAIDWACHGNDGASVIGEVLEFDEAIRLAYNFYLQHPDETLIVVTADHETGGMALGNSHYELDLRFLANQKMSAGKISEEVKALQKQFGKKLKWEQVKSLFAQNLGLYDKVEVSAEEDAQLQSIFRQMMKNKASDTKTLYASLSALSDAAVQLLNKKAQIGWTTHSHSAAAVPVFAVGVGAERFTGWHDNSELMGLILEATKH